ncbi:hypothetical protein EON65_21555, partial [archaeon]
MKYLDFEIDLLEDHLETSSSDPIEEKQEKSVFSAKARLFRCFHRSLSLPLVGQDKILKKCESCCEDFVSSHEEGLKIVNPTLMETKVQRAEQELEKRILFEKRVFEVSEQHE